MIYIENDLEKFRPEIDYSIKIILKHAEVDDKSIDFYYTDKLPDAIKNKRFIHVMPSRNIFSNDKYGKNESFPTKIESIKLEEETIPVLFSKGRPYIKENKLFFSTSIDLVETSFFFLTRYEESVIKKRDKLSRFPDEESLIIKYGLNFTPVLDVYSKIIMNWLEEMKPKSFFLLSHDIDRLKTRVSFRHAVKEMIHRNFKAMKFYFKDRKEGISHSLSDILKTELEFKVGSISFFMVRKGNIFRPDSDYNIKSDEIRKKITDFRENSDIKIGLHPSLKTFMNADLLRKEKRIADAVLGNVYLVRKHYLRYSMDFTFKNLSDLEFKYDSSIGYINHVGYKCGTSKPFLIFDPVKRHVLDITEIPLIVMDQALIRSSKNDVKTANYILGRLIDNTLAYGGILTILWHNHMVMKNPLNGDFDGYYRKIVKMLIDSQMSDFSKKL